LVFSEICIPVPPRECETCAQLIDNCIAVIYKSRYLIVSAFVWKKLWAIVRFFEERSEHSLNWSQINICLNSTTIQFHSLVPSLVTHSIQISREARSVVSTLSRLHGFYFWTCAGLQNSLCWWP